MDTNATHFKNLRNRQFVSKHFLAAIESYSQGLELDPNSVELLSNRAAAFLKIKCYQRALEDATKVLELDASHVKAIYRKVKSFWGQGAYKECTEFLNNIHRALKTDDTIAPLLNETQRMKEEKETGIISGDAIIKLFQQRAGTCEEVDLAEFRGAVKIKESKIHGGGLFASDRIMAGEFILSSKAFNIVFTKAKLEEMKGEEGSGSRIRQPNFQKVKTGTHGKYK